MGTKRTAAPPSPQVAPIDQRALGAALQLFVSRFVVDAKRKQIHQRLVVAERRRETLDTLPRWLACRTTPLAGADQSPAGLQTRLGDVLGICLDETAAVRTTIGHALERLRAAPGLFVADTGQLALVTVAGDAPLLCSWL